MSAPAKLAVLVSGTGRSLQNLAERIESGELPCRIELVLSNAPRAPALERAADAHLATAVIPHQGYPDTEAFSRDVFAKIEAHGCDLAVLAGFLRVLAIPERWLGRVLNVHPALLPAFAGKGFYGERVHRAVLESGTKFTGCTVHYVTNEVDAGPILHQRCIPVLPGDSLESLAERVFAEEKQALPEAIAMHLRGEGRAALARLRRPP